jgi:hypothetical protein
MRVIIIIDGIERTYNGDYHELHTRDWNELLRDHLDSAQEYEEERLCKTKTT